MRILKYSILLIVLMLVGIVIYLATKDGQYATHKSSLIPLEKSTIFTYVNDFRNWEEFFDLKTENPNTTYSFSKKTIGIDGAFSWESSKTKGSMTNVYVKESDSIAYKFWNAGSMSNAYITLKDTIGGTKVTMASQDDLDFFGKISSFFTGSVEKKTEVLFENSLRKLEAALVYETNVFSIKVDGPTVFNQTYYIYQVVSAKLEDVHGMVTKILPKLREFIQSNGLVEKGKPFIQYYKPNFASGRVTFSVCVPLTQEIFTTSESQYNFGKIDRFSALKTTFTGDYSHYKKAWKQGLNYVKENNLHENPQGNYLEVFTKNPNDAPKPSEWITTIYIPIGVTTVSEINPEAMVTPHSFGE